MKKLLYIFCIFSVLFASAQNEIMTSKNMPYYDWGGKRYMGVSKPTEYGSTSKRYPLLVFLHGAGEANNSSPNNPAVIWNSSGSGGPPYLINHSGWPNSFTNPSDGLDYQFIVIAPQAGSWSPAALHLDYIIRGAVDSFRVDTSRIYVTGLSAGADGIMDYMNKNGFTPRYKIAAWVPQGSAHDAVTQAYMNVIVDDSVKAWGFGDTVSDVHGMKTKTFMTQMNTRKAGVARFTGNAFGHAGWMTYYVPTYKETINGSSINIYEWMLTKTRSTATAGPSVSISGGSPKTVTLPTSSTSVTASATAGAGSITAYSWTRISGPNTPGIQNNTTATVTLGATGTALVQGTYVYQCLVTQTDAQTASVQVTINVNASAPPTAVAGTDQTVSDQTSFSVNGSSSAAAAGRTITGYAWSKISGGAATITSASSASTTITGVVGGAYVFRLTVTQSDAQTSTDDITITNNITTAPTVNAGGDQAVTLPSSSVTLAGSAIPGSGSITAYAWTRTSGPNSPTITTATAATTTVTGLIAGTYVFRLTATQTGGATGYDEINVVVTAATTCNPLPGVRYVITPTGGATTPEIYITNASQRGWKGGDTLVIQALAYPYGVIEIDSFGGDPCRDIVIINSGGQVLCNGPMRFQKDVHHVKVTGTGTAGITYGFKIVNSAFASSRMSHFTLENLEVGPNTGGVGLYMKQDPYNNQPWNHYPNYVMTKVIVRNTYIHDVAGEGMYIGHTYPWGDPALSNNVPQRMDSVEIYNNIVENTGWDGIQLSNARNGAKIYGNTVNNFGTANIDAQRAGIILGGNTKGDVYNNTVTNGMGNGIEIFGYDTLRVYNNTVTNVGNTLRTTNGEESIYGSATPGQVETNPNMKPRIYNNQINYPKVRGAIRINNNFSVLDNSYIADNRFCFTTNPGPTWKTAYILIGASWTDVNNTLSCETTPNQTPTASAGNDQSITLPTDAVNVQGNGSDPDGTITTYLWEKLTGGTATIVDEDSAATAITGLEEGTYTFKLTVTDNIGATDTDTLTVIVNPEVIADPIANAGADQIIYLPADSTAISGSGSTGAITRFRWLQTSGTTAEIADSTASLTIIRGLDVGVYEFQLTVSHDSGVYGTDTITIVVLPTPPADPRRPIKILKQTN